jgi:hypothetical protein
MTPRTRAGVINLLLWSLAFGILLHSASATLARNVLCESTAPAIVLSAQRQRQRVRQVDRGAASQAARQQASQQQQAGQQQLLDQLHGA